MGNGYDLQTSYLFPKNYEIITRYSRQYVDSEIRNLHPNTTQYTIGLTKYLWEHAFKLQTELTFDNQQFFNGSTSNSFYFRFQVEIGI